MKFDKPSAVATIVYWLKQADLPRSGNRALINNLFNGENPYSAAEQDDNNINTNVNFLDAPRIAHQARNTLNNAFLKPGYFFKVSIEDVPPEEKFTVEREITGALGRIMKGSKSYLESLRSSFAQTVLHGLGPSMWDNQDVWWPRSVAMADFVVPGRTLSSLENLNYFGVLREYSPSQLYSMTHGSKVDKGWNMKLVNQTLKDYRDKIFGANNQLENNPEKVAEAMKADLAFYETESSPVIRVWDFYHKDEESVEEKWYRKMILDGEAESDMSKDFLYSTKRVEATSLDQLAFVLVADGANVAPFLYHSVRGLGWLLYAVCHMQNRLLCKNTDATFEQFMWYFRVHNPEDQERLNKVDLHHLGIIPNQLEFVKGQDRYQPNPNFVQGTFAMNRQLMAESSAQFRQDLNDGTSKEMTAQEAMIRAQSANALVGSMLNLAYSQKVFEYKEICRRFCRKNSSDPDVKKFWKEMKKKGVNEKYLDSEKWNIEPEQVLGEGNRALEMAQIQLLMGMYPLLDPGAQAEVKHMAVEAYTNNPKLAERLVPTAKKQISDEIHDAQLAAGALMNGLPVTIRTGMNHIDYIEALLVSMGMVIDRIKQNGNMTDKKEIMGLMNISSHISQHMQILSQDKNQAQRVKQYSDALGKFNNEIKGFAQRLAEQQGGDMSETQAKIQEKMMLAEVNAKIKQDKAAQQNKLKDEQFLAEQARENARTQNEIQQEVVRTGVEATKIDILTAAEIRKKQNDLPPAQD